jgi:putative transcriptional regulator
MEDDKIIINLDVMLAKRKMQLTELSELIGSHITNLSIFKNGKGKAIKLKVLMRICKVLKCTPNDIIEFRETTLPKAGRPTSPSIYQWQRGTPGDANNTVNN